MSVWTHVAAIIRYDAIRIQGMPDTMPELGNICDYDSSSEDWDKCNIPCGSEGSLQYHKWTNPHPTSLAAYSVMFWGDLRDYDNATEILEYFKKITSPPAIIRQGVLVIGIEGKDEVVYHYLLDKWIEQTKKP
jgi:hypothetical protein